MSARPYFVAALLFAGLMTAAARAEEAAPAKAPFQLLPTEKKVVDAVNAERAAHGLSPLKIDEELQTSARDHAYWMCSVENLQHTSQPVAENIAWGQDTPDDAVRAWMNSPGHRANILGGYSRVGAAAYRRTHGRIYWCLQLLR